MYFLFFFFIWNECPAMKTIFSTCARRFSLTSGDLCLSSLQPRSGGDGNRRLEVDGRLPSAPGGRSLPLAGVRPVPLPRTAPQAPQTILKATKHTLARSLSLTHTCTDKSSQTHRDNQSPWCYLQHYHPEPAVSCLFKEEEEEEEEEGIVTWIF